VSAFLCKSLNCLVCVLGQLGLGRLENKPQVSINNSFPSVLQVSAGANHTAVLTKSGQVKRSAFVLLVVT
jgi:hypothetical protein